MVGVGGAAARAVQLSPAVFAVGAGVGVAQLELVLHSGISDTVINVAQEVF